MPKQPEVTAKPIDPVTDMGKGFSLSSAAPAASASPSNDGAASSPPPSRSVDPMEAARQEKLGALVVQLGGNTEEKVFGSSDSAVMRAYRERRVPDLLVINRREDDAAAHPFVWFKPWTWMSSGPQVSPLRWSEMPRGMSAAAQNTTETQTPSSPMTAFNTAEAGSQGPAVDKQESILLKAAAAAAAEKKKKKKSGLPPVVMTPLTKAEVEEKLTPQVREDRDKLLKSEERIHKVLQGIEDTRYKYLVPSQDLSCEQEVIHVVTCYHKRNAEAEKKRAAILQKRKAEVEKGFSNQIDDADLDVPIVLFDALACGPQVQALKKCTAGVVASYSEGSLD